MHHLLGILMSVKHAMEQILSWPFKYHYYIEILYI